MIRKEEEKNKDSVTDNSRVVLKKNSIQIPILIMHIYNFLNTF